MKGYVVCVYKNITNEEKLKEYALKNSCLDEDCYCVTGFAIDWCAILYHNKNI